MWLGRRTSLSLGLRAVAVLFALKALVTSASAADANDTAEWPGFRGARADGVAAARGVFGSGSVRLEIAWKRPLGKGYSGVSIAEGRAVTLFSDGVSDVVIAFDAASGSELWRHALGETYRGHDGSQDGPISTPFLSGGRVFALGPRGTLVALHAETGGEIWRTDLVRDHGAVKPHWGFGTSPLTVSGVLLVQIGAKGALVAGFEPATGRRLWGVGDDSVSYQSPVPVLRSGRERVPRGEGDDERLYRFVRARSDSSDCPRSRLSDEKLAVSQMKCVPIIILVCRCAGDKHPERR